MFKFIINNYFFSSSSPNHHSSSWWMSAHNGRSITGPQSIVNFYLGLYYFSFIIFLKWSQTKWISVYQVLGGRLIDRVDDKGKYNFPFFSTKLFHQDFDYRGWLVNRGSTASEYHDQTKAHALIHWINWFSRLDWPL